MPKHQERQKRNLVVKSELSVVVAAVLLLGVAGCGFIFPIPTAYDPAELSALTADAQATGLSGQDLVDWVQNELRTRFPILQLQLSPPLQNLDDGAPGSVIVIFRERREYLLIASVPAVSNWSQGPETESAGLGCSFVGGLTVTDYVLEGELQSRLRGAVTDEVYGPGQPAGTEVTVFDCEGRVYGANNGVLLLEHGIGAIPAELYSRAFALANPRIEAENFGANLLADFLFNAFSNRLRDRINGILNVPPAFGGFNQFFGF